MSNPNSQPYTIQEHLLLLKERGLLFKNEETAIHFLKNISYFHLKAYWLDKLIVNNDENINKNFKNNTYFEDIIECYNFDRHLRLILFDAIERIEIAFRAKMINLLSLKYGGLWYNEPSLFDDKISKKGVKQSIYLNTLNKLSFEFKRSSESFARTHKKDNSNNNPDAWKILEVASLGTLSKLYKCLKNELKVKSDIAKDMGFNISSQLSSCLEAITYLRNIIAHHSFLYNRNMVKIPKEKFIYTSSIWLKNPLKKMQKHKPFLIITYLIYICNIVSPGHHIKSKILNLLNENPKIIYKYGFFNKWNLEPIWCE